MDLSDTRLVNQVREGKTESFAMLVDRYRDGAVRAACHLVGDAEAAQDLAQEAFVDAYRSLRDLREPERFRAWLHGILHHKCARHLSRSARSPVTSDLIDSSSPPPHDPLAETTLDALNRLPEDCRSLLAARYLQELSYEEIAFALKTSVNNVRVRCSRAKAQLRALLAGEEVESVAQKGGSK